MKSTSIKSVAAVAVSLAVLGTASIAAAQGDAYGKQFELSLMGGIQALSQNDTAIPDNILNVPAVATLGYRLSPILAVEGEFTWMIPVEQSVDLAAGSRDMKTPDVLAYQASLRADLPVSSAALSPYLVAGSGAVTFLSNTDANRLPALAESQTMFAISFGGGLTYGLTPSWGLRGDFREFGAFPSNDTAGLSSGGSADPIWMSRGTVGLAYRF